MEGRESVAVSASSAIGVVESLGSGGPLSELERKSNGSPRKNGQDGNMGLQLLSPGFSPSMFSHKRGRGRPPGTGNRQMLAALGEWVSGTAGGNFTPHVITIAAGEDVATRIMSFSKKGPRSICILSANGAISNVTLHQPGLNGGTLTYEGRFEILSLSGSFTAGSCASRMRTGGISVSLAGPDGRVIGGGVAGLLLAASPIQVVVGSFTPNKDHKRKFNSDDLSVLSPAPSPGVLTTARPISQANPDEEPCAVPSFAMAGQRHGDTEHIRASSTPNTNSASFPIVGWHGLKSTDPRPSPDINICPSGE